MIGIQTQINPLLHKFLGDVIPENIAMLQFKIDAANADVKILIKNRSSYFWIYKTSDSSGLVNIQTVATNNAAADISPALFNRYSGVYFFKIFAGDTLVQVGSYEGVSLKFSNVAGHDSYYTITFKSASQGGGVGSDDIGGTLQVY